jgi:hypothetical protein
LEVVLEADQKSNGEKKLEKGCPPNIGSLVEGEEAFARWVFV